MRSALILMLSTIGAVAALRAQGTPPSIAQSTLIKAARVVDVAAGAYRVNYCVLISNGRIVQVGPLAEIQRRAPAGTATIDVGSATLLPGLIDAHAHVLASMDGRLEPGPNIIAAVALGLPRRVLLGVSNARELLEAGFTTVRNLGHSGVDGDIALRDAIETGSVSGPRILAAGRKITPPGGQAVANQSPDATVLNQEFIPVRGVAEAERAVDSLIAAHVDVVKIVADDDKRVLERDEVTAIVQAAHRARLRVAAHATTVAGIQVAIDGGVDSIEHGNEATDVMLAAMRDKGIALVATIWTAEALRDIVLSERVMTDPQRRAAEMQLAAFVDSYSGLVQRAMKAGVTIAAGSDMWMRYPGKTRGQATKTMFSALVRAGMSPASVLRAATMDAADVLGWGDRVGSLNADRFADIIAFQGDPLANVAALDAVTFAMKGGVVITPPSR